MAEYYDEIDDPTAPAPISPARAGFADGLTLFRAVLTPVIMGVIVWGWQSTETTSGIEIYQRMLEGSILASVLFGVAALTDVLDDAFGGAEMAGSRTFGWFDDIADLILVVGTLAALLFVTARAGTLGLGLAIPAVVIIGREVLVGALKGYEFSRRGWPQTGWGTAKTAIAMLATLLLVASPWLTGWLDRMRATDENALQVYGETSPLIWNIGLVGLWLAAILSVVSGIILFTRKS